MQQAHRGRSRGEPLNSAYRLRDILPYPLYLRVGQEQVRCPDGALPAAEAVVGTCLFRIVWVFTVFERFQSLRSLYVVFPLTWVVTSAAVCVSFAEVWSRLRKNAA